MYHCRNAAVRPLSLLLRLGLTRRCRGDVAIISLKDPGHWVLEQVLPGVGGRTLGGLGHADIVRCAYLDSKVSRYTLSAHGQSLIVAPLQTSTVVSGAEDGKVCLWSV